MAKKEPDKISIYTDGSCLGNPGTGGYAFVIIRNDNILTEFAGTEQHTTNNRMELSAVIHSLSILLDDYCGLDKIHIELGDQIQIFSDSTYVLKGITEWIQNWKENNWKTGGNKQIKNMELWRQMDNIVSRSKLNLNWHWVKSHNGNKWNEYVDNLAHSAANNLKVSLEIRHNPEVTLSKSQKIALQKMMDGKNILITGPAGYGKTYLINFYVSKMQESNTSGVQQVAVTSTTGTSAIHIKGTTLHSWGGIGLGQGSVGAISTKIKKKTYLRDRWRNTKVLIIDEVSMLSPQLFDKLDKIAKNVRRNIKPFGGLQLILTGDFLQLPCINSDGFCFDAQTWETVIDEVVYLTENLRQSDPVWRKCLEEARLGNLTKESKKLLKSRVNIELKNDIGITPTVLYPLNVNVDEVNNHYLQILEEKNGMVNDYEMEVELYEKKNRKRVEKLKKNCPAPEKLSLTPGCQVMLLWNLDIENGLVNGSRGVVVRFIRDLPIIKFLNGETRLIDYHIWEVEEDDKKIVSFEQLPLKLAYAISIHKSQGSTLDYAIVDLTDVFEYGQGYVALSRVKSHQGLSIKGIDFRKIRAHPGALEFYENDF